MMVLLDANYLGNVFIHQLYVMDMSTVMMVVMKKTVVSDLSHAVIISSIRTAVT